MNVAKQQQHKRLSVFTLELIFVAPKALTFMFLCLYFCWHKLKNNLTFLSFFMYQFRK